MYNRIMAMLGYPETLLAIICFLLLCHWILNRNSHIRNWPILGMLPSVPSMCNMQNMLRALNLYGGTFDFRGPWFSNMNGLVTCDARNVHHILTKNFDNYNKGPAFRETFEAFGDGIFSSDGDEWRYSRAILHSLFRPKSFDLLLERSTQKKLKNSLLPLLDHFQDQGMEINLQSVFYRFSYDNICSIVIGFDPNCLSITFPRVVHSKAFDEVFRISFYRYLVPRSFWKLQKWLQVGEEKRMAKAREIVDNFLQQCVKQKREDLSKRANNISEDEDEQHLDLLTTLILEEQRKRNEIDDNFLKDATFTLISAGKDTLTVGLTWFFWLVATHPSVETKILNEIKEKFSEKLQAQDQMILGATEVKELVYLHGAICESLRLFPSLAYNARYEIKPEILPSGHHVGRNTFVLLSFYAMGRSEALWGEDCLEFKQEIWISKTGSIVHVPSYKFIAFNAGPRICLGKEMGLTEMKMVAVAILWNYHVQVVEGHSVSLGLSIAMPVMRHGLKVRIIKRDK